jgi:redox-sensitive bicupin YhaK (pirin superfamily)
VKLRRRQAIGGLLSVPAITLAGCHGKGGTHEAAIRRAPETTPKTDAVVKQFIASLASVDGQGATLQRVFPQPALKNLDPFVLLDDFDVRVPAGFPEHGHRGFEAFTYMIEGAFHHRDNLGNDSRIGPGGTQRFNSGRGARHSEMPATDGSNRGLQLWVNLPRAKKAMEPEYAGIAGEDMPVDEDARHLVRTVVGGRSAVALHTEVDDLDVTLLADGEWGFAIPKGRNSFLYALEGTLRVGDVEVPRGHGVVLSPGDLSVRGAEGSRFAFLSGRPHGEPIVHRGPVVD